jgi:hypothetical protein
MKFLFISQNPLTTYSHCFPVSEYIEICPELYLGVGQATFVLHATQWNDSANQQIFTHKTLNNCIQTIAMSIKIVEGVYYCTHLQIKLTVVSTEAYHCSIVFLDIIHRPVFLFKTQHFRDWILSLTSGRSLLSWVQLVELIMSKNSIIVLIYHHQRLLDLTYHNV